VLSGPTVDTPARRPGSIRRTSHLDVTGVDNPAAQFVQTISGRARDLLTDAAGGASVVADASLSIHVGDDGLLDEAISDPPLPQLATALGARLGRGFRAEIGQALAATAGQPLGLLLNDLTGSPAAMRYNRVRRGLDVREGRRQLEVTPAELSFIGCAGDRSRRAALDGTSERPPLRDAPSAPRVEDGDDALAWHELPPLLLEQGRRRRRIDLWREGAVVRTDAFFRDSTIVASGDEMIVHEYLVQAELDPDGRILSVSADPRVLPFDECPYASERISQVEGWSIEELAIDIHRVVRGDDCCTHLNDMVRFLADVPVLARLLP
jgi:hypothetical protein